MIYLNLPRSRDLRTVAISFVIVLSGLVFPMCTSAFFHSSMPTYKYEVSPAVDGGNSNSWIKQESSLQDEVVKNFTIEHWLVFLIMHTPDNLHNLSIAGWIGAKDSSIMTLKMDGTSYSPDFSGRFRFEDNQPNNVTVGRGEVEFVFYPNEVRVMTLHADYGTFNFTMTSRGLPFWFVRNEDEMIVCAKNHVTGYPTYVGGFADLVTVSGTVQGKHFEGYGAYCHWWTNELETWGDWANFFVNQEDFYLGGWESWNRTDPSIRYLNTGFLGFPKKNQYYSFDNFRFLYSGVDRYTVVGSYENGTVTINGRRIGGLMDNVPYTSPVTGIYILWDGILTFNQEEIAVDGEGSGEIAVERDGWARASFEYFPEKPTANEQITFNASASDSSGGNITSYEWNFDDGNTTKVTEPIINHTYALPGRYTVTLKVMDDNGLWDTTTRTITVYFIADLNKDGAVNIYDVVIVANAFGSKPGDSNWNATADLDKNEIVDIFDVVKVAREFGKSLFHPLYTFNVPWHGLNYTIIAVSNSTVTDFNFDYSLKHVSFNVTGLPATMGYCNISIPKTFMWCDSPSQWDVTVDGSPINDLTVTEDTHTYLYFTYNHSTHEVIIKAGNVISEFPSAVILLLFMTITLLGVFFAKKRLPRDR